MSGVAEWRRSLLPWRARFADDCELRLDSSVTVRVSQAPSASKAAGRRSGDGDVDPGVTGSTVWDGAVVLAHYACTRSVWAALESRLGAPAACVLELGAGTGLAGLALACAGVLSPPARVVLSDLEAVTPLLLRNAARNLCATAVSVRALRWGDAQSATEALEGALADVVLGADLVYRQPNVAPLLSALAHTLRRGGVALLALDCSHCPEAVQDFRHRAQQPQEGDPPVRYALRDVPTHELRPGCVTDEVMVLQLWRT